MSRELTKEQQDWLEQWLELWGAWVYSGRLEKRMSSMIAQWMESVEPSGYPTRPMCNDDDGMLISQVVDSVLKIDPTTLGILMAYYVTNKSKRAIAAYYYRSAKPRKISNGRLGEGWRRPSEETLRKEVSERLKASQYMIFFPLENAMKMRKIKPKVKYITRKRLTW